MVNKSIHWVFFQKDLLITQKNEEQSYKNRQPINRDLNEYENQIIYQSTINQLNIHTYIIHGISN